MFRFHEIFNTKKIISTFFMITGTHRAKETIIFAVRLDAKPGDGLVKMFSVTTGALHGVVEVVVIFSAI